jgi:hypothetical protein
VGSGGCVVKKAATGTRVARLRRMPALSQGSSPYSLSSGTFGFKSTRERLEAGPEFISVAPAGRIAPFVEPVGQGSGLPTSKPGVAVGKATLSHATARLPHSSHATAGIVVHWPFFSGELS